MTAEETIASLETRLKQALERLEEVSEQLRVAQAHREELEEVLAGKTVRKNVMTPIIANTTRSNVVGAF